MKTTYFYNDNQKLMKMAGTPRNAAAFEKNSENANRVEIWTFEAYHVSSQIFFLTDGRWLGMPEKSGEKYFRLVLEKAKTTMHIKREEVISEDMDKLLDYQSKISLEAARNEIAWCKPEDEQDKDGRYWLSAYRGAIVYRLIVKNGRIIGSIPGGFHDSHKPKNVCQEAWEKALKSAIEEKIGTGYALPKADGSGTYFYLRHSEDSYLLHTKQYDVPSAKGGFHHNIEVV